MIMQQRMAAHPVSVPHAGARSLQSSQALISQPVRPQQLCHRRCRQANVLRCQKTDLEPVKVDNKPMPRWDVIWQYLVEKKLPTFSPQEAQQKVRSGKWLLVDVRPEDNHEEAHPEGALSVPLFKKVQWGQTTFMGFVRAAAMAVNGVTPMAINDSFKEDLAAATKGKGAILMCEAGGTLTPSSNFVTGKVSRSLKAAYQALEKGQLKNVAHLDGGVYNWYKNGLPMNGEYNTSNLGRTPNAAAAPTGKYFDDKD